jgi:polar amino acid transport system substrate-binding protein
MTNDLVALFKDTSVVSVIAVVELSKEYQMLTRSGGGYLQIGLTTAALYLVMSVPLGYLSRYLERRWAEGGAA